MVFRDRVEALDSPESCGTRSTLMAIKHRPSDFRNSGTSRTASPIGIALLLAALLLVLQSGGNRALAQSAGDEPAGTAALVGDACPDGSIGQPPSCFAVTGDTSAALTTVMTPATLAARGREPFSQVLGVMAINSAGQPAAIPVPIPAAVSVPDPSPSRPLNSAAIIAAAPQLPNAGTGGLLPGANDASPLLIIPLLAGALAAAGFLRMKSQSA
jgi:hypothetical protein